MEEKKELEMSFEEFCKEVSSESETSLQNTHSIMESLVELFIKELN